jgi:fatty-acid peroxygenase
VTATTAGARTTLAITRDPLPDNSLALAFDPYQFISRRRQEFGTDLFACRLMLRKTVCIGGPDAARLFYDTASFRRAGVVPGPVRKTLLGEGGIHGLDGITGTERLCSSPSWARIAFRNSARFSRPA